MDKLQQCSGTDPKGNRCALWEGHNGPHAIRNRNKDRLPRATASSSDLPGGLYNPPAPNSSTVEGSFGTPLNHRLIATTLGMPLPAPYSGKQCQAIDPWGVHCTLPEGHVREHGSPLGFMRPAPDQELNRQGARKDGAEVVGPLTDAKLDELDDPCRYPTYVVSMAREIRASRQRRRDEQGS